MCINGLFSKSSHIAILNFLLLVRVSCPTVYTNGMIKPYNTKTTCYCHMAMAMPCCHCWLHQSTIFITQNVSQAWFADGAPLGSSMAQLLQWWRHFFCLGVLSVVIISMTPKFEATYLITLFHAVYIPLFTFF